MEGTNIPRVLHISHAAALMIEHGLDCWGEAAWAQIDVRAYYDELPVLRIAQFLIARGCNGADIAAALRHQLFVQLDFEFDGHVSRIPARSRGGITGSRIASLLQRVPVESSLLHCHGDLRLCGLECGPARFCAASSIDNLYFPARFGSSAARNVELVEKHLNENWNLTIKPDSKKIVVSRGQDDHVVSDDWTIEDTSNILGRFISTDNSIRPSFDVAKQRMWGSFFANVRVKHWHKLGIRRRLLLIDRAIEPVLKFHAAAWAPQRQVALEVDRMQRRMVSSALALHRDPDEDISLFKRRVGKGCAKCISTKWSSL